MTSLRRLSSGVLFYEAFFFFACVCECVRTWVGACVLEFDSGRRLLFCIEFVFLVVVVSVAVLVVLAAVDNLVASVAAAAAVSVVFLVAAPSLFCCDSSSSSFVFFFFFFSFSFFLCLSLLFSCVFRTDAGNKAAKLVMRLQRNIARKSRSPVNTITAQVCPSGSLSGDRMTSQQLPTENKGIIISCFPYFASKDLGSIPLRLSFLFKKVVVCGHCLVTWSITSYWNIKMALIAAHLNAGIILVVTV